MSVLGDSDKTRARGHYGLFLVLPAPIHAKLRNTSLDSVVVERKDFGELLEKEWANCDRDAMKETTSVLSVVLVNISQHTFVCLIQCFG